MLNFRQYALLRNAGAPELIELFVVAAVAAALAVRWLLAPDGYPPPGGSDLRLAPLLWGGLLLLLALLLPCLALGRAVQRIAAILGGIGGGVFIDELGRFITADYHYLYQPTLGFGYIILVSLFLSLRYPLLRIRLTPDAALSNALTLLAAAPGGRPDGVRRQEILRLLSHADAINPLVTALSAYVGVSDAGADTGKPGSRLAQWYQSLAQHPRYRLGLTAFFILYAGAHFGMAAWFALSDAAAVLTFQVQAQLASSIVAVMVVAFGLGRLRPARPDFYSRSDAYRWFARAALFNILLTAVFAFTNSPPAALGGLAVSLLVYAALRYMTEQEQPPAASVNYTDRAAAGSSAAAPSLSSGECG